MALLCFVLDLRSLSPVILRDLKQALFQLANYYAVLERRAYCSSRGSQSKAKPLLDRIGLCYVFRNRITCIDELKIAYNPYGNFNLRDLHHAVNNLPTDAFSSEPYDSGSLYLKLADLLSEKVVYNWGDRDEGVGKKVILISSCAGATMDSTTTKALMDAGDKCVQLEFLLLEQTSSHLGDAIDTINHFAKQIDLHILYGLAKRWFLELKDDLEKPLQAHFVFKANLFSTLNQISCSLCPSFHRIVDEFKLCQTCRCHGAPLDYQNMNQIKYSCPVNNDNLGPLDMFENSIRVGEQTILHMPSFEDCPEQNQISSPIEFNVIQRINLGSLSEGLIMGGTYFVTPSTFHEGVENDKSELNNELFQVVCRVLYSLDQGFICSSNCNIETASVTSFGCYYILLPSDKGLMLLRRLSASEEFLPVPGVSQLTSSFTVQEMENTVHASLLKMEVSDYNPFQYERGFHRKLNLLVKESLQFGAIRPKGREGAMEPGLGQKKPEVQPAGAVTGDELPQLDTEPREKQPSPSLAEEWEQLIVTELGGTRSPTCISASKQDKQVVSPSQTNRQLDEKTSRILERLEAPRQLKRKSASPTITNTLSADICAPVKKPLIPYLLTDTGDQALTASQPMKPSFQRIKKKR